MAVESYLEQFLENSRRMRDQVRDSTEVMGQVTAAITGTTWNGKFYSWLDGTYCRIISGELGVKIRDDYHRPVAVSVKADVYYPGIPMTPFAVVLDHPSGRSPLYEYYLVQDLGDVWDVDDPNIIIRKPHFLRSMEQLETHLESKGYGECPELRYHSLGFSGDKIVIHDLDCEVMIKRNQIQRGAVSGKGEFGYLREIYERLASPEFSLRI